MDPIALVSIAAVLGLYIVVALCAMWAWGDRQYLLAVPLTMIFAASTVAIVWTLERWGT